MARTIKKQVVIKTDHTKRATPGLATRGENIKTPVNIYGRTYRDPRRADLTDIERAMDENEVLVTQLKSAIETKNQENLSNAEKAKIEARAIELAQEMLEQQKGGKE